MIRYNTVEDPLCYPGTQVLRNRLDIRDQNELDEFEQLMFQSRAREELPDATFDFLHYRALHKHFFQDVYEWAGEIRAIRTGKGSNWFCYPEYIEAEAQRIFHQLADRHFFTESADKEEFVNGTAWFLSEINAVHPFREGNGRIQLVFLTLLARNAGLELNERKLRTRPFLDAMIQSFSGDVGPLVQEIRRTL